jgi:hypothetical protein
MLASSDWRWASSPGEVERDTPDMPTGRDRARRAHKTANSLTSSRFRMCNPRTDERTDELSLNRVVSYFEVS